jgi:hypothetical protein
MTNSACLSNDLKVKRRKERKTDGGACWMLSTDDDTQALSANRGLIWPQVLLKNPKPLPAQIVVFLQMYEIMTSAVYKKIVFRKDC